MRVLALTHGPRVRSERFGEIVREQRHELVEWELPTQGPPPDGFDAVMVFGGRMNVGEEPDNPWLADEYELLRGWVAAELPPRASPSAAVRAHREHGAPHRRAAARVVAVQAT